MASPNWTPVRSLPPRADQRDIVDAVNTIIKQMAQFRGPDFRAYTEPVVAAYTVDDGDWSIYADASATTTLEIILPAAASYPGRILHIKKIDDSDNVVLVTPAGTEEIEGETSLWTISRWFNWVIQSDGVSDWYRII